jgi:hypothetical protein
VLEIVQIQKINFPVFLRITGGAAALQHLWAGRHWFYLTLGIPDIHNEKAGQSSR